MNKSALSIHELSEDRSKLKTFWQSISSDYINNYVPLSFSIFQRWVLGMRTFYEISQLFNKTILAKDDIYADVVVDDENTNLIVQADLTKSNGESFNFSSFNENSITVDSTALEKSLDQNKGLIRFLNKNYVVVQLISEPILEEAKDFIIQYTTSYYLRVIKHDIQVVEPAHVLASMLIDCIIAGDSRRKVFGLYKKKPPCDLQSLMFVYENSRKQQDSNDAIRIATFLHSIPKDRLFNFSFLSKGTVQSDIEIFMMTNLLQKRSLPAVISGIPNYLFWTRLK